MWNTNDRWNAKACIKWVQPCSYAHVNADVAAPAFSQAGAEGFLPFWTRRLIDMESPLQRQATVPECKRGHYANAKQVTYCSIKLPDVSPSGGNHRQFMIL